MGKRSAAVLLFSLGSVFAVAAMASPPAANTPEHVLLVPASIKWMPAPPVLPKGIQLAVLRGNPSAKGPCIVRLKIPPHTVIAPHWHPTEESFSVLSGEVFVGMGDKVDKASAKALPVMGFASMPATHHHYVYTESKGAVIDLSFYGPFQIHYVNAADDPSRRSMPSH
ncbi:MAG: cupin domain-containing protein [Rhodanobacteraceae bacterium]